MEEIIAMYEQMGISRSVYQYGEHALQKLQERFAAIDMVINKLSLQEVLPELEPVLGHEQIRVMVHEQYFYPDYRAYQPDFGEKLDVIFAFLAEHGYASRFFEEMIW